MASPLRVCAAVEAEELLPGRRQRRVELRLVAEPLGLAQRARLAMWPPWTLGPGLRFTWRLEGRGEEEAKREVKVRPRRPRSTVGIGGAKSMWWQVLPGVSGGFGGDARRGQLEKGPFSMLLASFEHDEPECPKVRPCVSPFECQVPEPEPFQLLSNCGGQAEPPKGLRLPLRSQQLQSLCWMQACERRSDPLLLGASREFLPSLSPPHQAQQLLLKALNCRAVARVQRTFEPRGGLLGDPVGSGKTAVTLALVASDEQGL